MIGLKKDVALKKSKRPAGSIVLYIASIVVTIIGVAYLGTNIIMFQKSVAQYVAQGYAAADVTSQLLLSQLLPGIYEPIAVYGGIALILFGAGMINQKISKCLNMLADPGVEDTEPDTDGINVVAPEVEATEIEIIEHDPERPEA